MGELSRDELDCKRIIKMMVGRSMDAEFPDHKRSPGKAACVQILAEEKVRDISLEVRAGEILALTGLVGLANGNCAFVVWCRYS